MERAQKVKPPYVVPSMREIAELPWNGLRVASTFSGGGGSCLGYRMAGYRVVWANEFVEAAQETYRANHPTSYLNTQDIRTVTAQDILREAKVDAIDLLDGSPPCASFSTAGSRDKGWGKVKAYSDKKQRTDDLFFEYARILKELQPKVFVAENVSGLIKGTAKGYFLEILRALKDCGYNVKCKLLNAQWLGVPQSRQRVIFVGVRNDLHKEPPHPSPLPYFYSLGDVLKAAEGGPVERETDMVGTANGAEWKRIGGVGRSTRCYMLSRPDPSRPCPTITTQEGVAGAASNAHPYEPRKFSLLELRKICGFPDDFVLTGSHPQKVERMGRAVPPVMMCRIASTIYEKVFT